VSSLQPRPAHRLLRCPLCKAGFIAAAGVLVCRNRHSFDLAREGYVNLLSGRRRRPAARGDSPAQLRHRAEFLDSGHLDTLTATIIRQVERSAPGLQHVLDAGSGTGHHLARITARLPGSIISLGLDISKDAARQAARRWPTPAFAVADLWAEWPVHDAAVDLVVSIFAPKSGWENYGAVGSSQSTSDWGDYLNSRPDSPFSNTWVATGFSYDGTKVTPQFMWFGRERDTPE
jgi:23S rRNA (guanine745-N1)-methyltransferase